MKIGVRLGLRTTESTRPSKRPDGTAPKDRLSTLKRPLSPSTCFLPDLFQPTASGEITTASGWCFRSRIWKTWEESHEKIVNNQYGLKLVLGMQRIGDYSHQKHVEYSTCLEDEQLPIGVVNVNPPPEVPEVRLYHSCLEVLSPSSTFSGGWPCCFPVAIKLDSTKMGIK